MKDINGKEFRVGDTIVYSGRGSCRSYLRQGVVEEIIHTNGRFRLKVVRMADDLVSEGLSYITPSPTTTAILKRHEVNTDAG